MNRPLGGVFNIMKDDMNEPYKSNVFKIILNWFKPRKVFNQLTAGICFVASSVNEIRSHLDGVVRQQFHWYCLFSFNALSGMIECVWLILNSIIAGTSTRSLISSTRPLCPSLMYALCCWICWWHRKSWSSSLLRSSTTSTPQTPIPRYLCSSVISWFLCLWQIWMSIIPVLILSILWWNSDRRTEGRGASAWRGQGRARGNYSEERKTRLMWICCSIVYSFLLECFTTLCCFVLI